MRRLGIDPGTRRVGVAVADEDAMFASARGTLDFVSDAETARAITKIADEEEAGEIVVGLPLGLDGREGLSSRRARSLAKAIAEASGRKVVLWDERMTSAAANRAMAATGASSRERRGKVDRIDPKTNKVSKTIELGVPNVEGDIIVAEGSAWVTLPGFPISRIDPKTDKVAQQFVGEGGGMIQASSGSILLTNVKQSNTWRLDPRRILATQAD